MTQTEPPLGRATILGLFAMSLAVLVIANDFTAGVGFSTSIFPSRRSRCW